MFAVEPFKIIQIINPSCILLNAQDESFFSSPHNKVAQIPFGKVKLSLHLVPVGMTLL